MGHPLLGRRIQGDRPLSHAWEVDLNLDALPYLTDHRLQGLTVLPGSLYVELALGAATAVYGEPPRRLDRIDFQNFLVLEEAPERLVHTVMDFAEDGVARVEVVSVESAETKTPAPRISHARLELLAEDGGS